VNKKFGTSHSVVCISWIRLFMVQMRYRSAMSKKFIQWPIKFAGASIGESISSVTFVDHGHVD